jgi:hypothetical protein
VHEERDLGTEFCSNIALILRNKVPQRIYYIYIQYHIYYSFILRTKVPQWVMIALSTKTLNGPQQSKTTITTVL